MRRRDLFRMSVAGAFSALTKGSNVSAEGAVRWSSPTKGLSIGLRLEPALTRTHLLILLRNAGATPLDLFIAIGLVQRFEFTAIAPDRKEYQITDRELYRLCAGLCAVPVVERIDPGAIRSSKFALDDLLYVPAKGEGSNLGILLRRGYSVRVAFEVTEQQLKENGLSRSDLWLGRVVCGEIFFK